MTEATLNTLQQWLATVLTVRGDCEQKLNTAFQHHGLSLNSNIKSSASLSAQRRIDIYASGYVMRLVECLKGEFSLLCKFMGEEVFIVFAKAYIVTRPSSDWTLYSLGEKFAYYLESTKPQGDFSIQQQAMFELPAELAYFERARAEVNLAKGLESQPALITPINELDLMLGNHSQLSLKPAPCLRMLTCQYNIMELIPLLEGNHETHLPKKHTTHIAITRINYRIREFELTTWQADFLIYCSPNTPFNKAVQESSKRLGLDSGALLAKLAMWLPTAINNALLCHED